MRVPGSRGPSVCEKNNLQNMLVFLHSIRYNYNIKDIATQSAYEGCCP